MKGSAPAIVAVRPRPTWAPYFEGLLENVSGERETSLELSKDATWRGKRILAQAAMVDDASEWALNAHHLSPQRLGSFRGCAFLLSVQSLDSRAGEPLRALHTK